MPARQVEYEGQLTFDDVVAADAVAAEHGGRRRWFNKLYSYAFWIVMWVLVLFSSGWLRLPPLLLGIMVIIIEAVNHRAARAQARRLFETHAALRDSFRSRFDETGFWTKGSIFQDFRSWDAFRAWAETRDHVFVYESEQGWGRIIPKRLLKDPAELEALRAILAAHLPQLGGTPPAAA